MIAILPEGSLAALARVDRLGDPISASAVVDQEMDVIGGHAVVQDRVPIPPPGLVQPLPPALAVPRASFSRNSRL